MPPVEGQTALQAVRGNSSLGIIKVITISDKAGQQELEATIARGANGYLIRPLTPTELYRTIHKHIEPHPRQVPRLNVIFRATVFTGTTGRSLFATVISELGVFVRTLKPLPKGSLIKLSLDLPSAKPIVLEGEVIYVVGPERVAVEEPGMGIKFVSLDKEIQTGLRRFIDEHLTGGVGMDALL